MMSPLSLLLLFTYVFSLLFCIILARELSIGFLPLPPPPPPQPPPSSFSCMLLENGNKKIQVETPT